MTLRKLFAITDGHAILRHVRLVYLTRMTLTERHALRVAAFTKPTLKGNENSLTRNNTTFALYTKQSDQKQDNLCIIHTIHSNALPNAASYLVNE
jgi:ABC-type branched-subunit amino acid transport system permease subunit